MTLYMHSLQVDLPKLMKAGSGLKLPRSKVDVGYLVHSALARMAGDIAPRPFSIVSETGRSLPVLGYSAASKSELQDAASACALPEHHEAIDWDRHACKPMPMAAFKEGKRFTFQLRACPVVRRRQGRGKSVEVDAFLGAQGDDATDVERFSAYRDWLQARVDGKGLELEDVSVSGFKLRALIRRTQGDERQSKVLSRPDVSFTGTLRVQSVPDFVETLAGGIGRHRAFGFGMLLLKPSR